MFENGDMDTSPASHIDTKKPGTRLRNALNGWLKKRSNRLWSVIMLILASLLLVQMIFSGPGNFPGA